MLKKELKFIDFNGEEQIETHYFNLTKAEIVELQLADMTIDEDGKTIKGQGFVERLQAVAKSGNGHLIMQVFKELILSAYGERSDDGRYFRKSKTISSDFESSPAYSELFVSLVTDANAAADFLNGVIPSDLAAEAEKQQVRPDGRPATSDHRPKQVASVEIPKETGTPPEELRTVNEPVALEAGASGEEMKVGPSIGDEIASEETMSYADYQRFIARSANSN